MLGAIIGDVIGSVYEHESGKTKSFELFDRDCRPTDDSILTICVGLACAEADCSNSYEFKNVLINRMYEIARRYPDAGYGEQFYDWLLKDYAPPYGGYTNGCAMRVSPCAWAVDTLAEVVTLAKWSAEITHDHPEGIKGAVSVASAIFLARKGADKDEIREHIEKYYYDLNFTLDEIRPSYHDMIECENSVPQAIVCFLESTDFEDAIRNAVSLGGDGDTLAAIAGSIAEAYYGIPTELEERVFDFIDEDLAEYYYEYSEILCS